MAVLVAVGGAALGSAIGIGAGPGWIIGSIAGNLLFPSQGPDIEGPRLGDLSVTASTYGAPIQKTFGTMRTGGNMIWSTGIKEVRNQNKVGGKGGGGAQTQVTYEYFVSFALAFGEGVVEDVLRIWADGKLIFDKTSTADDITKANLTFRFYPGDETQEPDSLIEADIGVNQTPAFRGITYIVFDTFPLKDHGNRVPNITVELTSNASSALNTQTVDFFTVGEGGLATSFQTDTLVPDYNRGVFYTAQSSGVVGQNIIRRFQTRTMVEDRQKAYTQDKTPEDIISIDLQIVMPAGEIIFNNGAGNGRPISMVNPDSLEIVDTFGDNTGGVGAFSSTQFPALKNGLCTSATVQGSSGTRHYLIAAPILGEDFGILQVSSSGLQYVYDTQTSGRGINGTSVAATGPGAVGDGFGEFYVLTSGGGFHLYKGIIPNNAEHDFLFGAIAGVNIKFIRTFSNSDLLPGATVIDEIMGLMYDETDDTIIFEFRADSVGHITKIDPETGNQIWEIATGLGARTGLTGANRTRITDGVFSRVAGTDSVSIRTATGEIFDTTSGWPVAANSAFSNWWDGKTSSQIGTDGSTIHKWSLFRGAGDGALLSDVVQSICLDAGLEASDIDVTDLATETVPGYMIGRLSTARASLQPLAQSFFFDAVESDFLLKFLLRDGKTSVATITQDDLAVMGNRDEFFTDTRIQEVELPRRFAVSFMDRDNDYLQQTQSAQRILGPVPSARSRNEMGLQIAAAFTSEFGKRIAEKQLYSAWIERSLYQIKTKWKFLALDPTDIITITMDDGTIFRGRIIQNDIGVDYSIEINALSEDAVQYTSTVDSDAGSGVPDQEFLSISDTKLILICSPLLRDSDDSGRTTSQIYFAMGGFGQPGWTSGTLFKSAEGTEFVDVESVVNEMAYGSASNALGDVACPFSTDETNTLTVFMTTGVSQVVSVTQLEMVNGANPAALIHSNGIDVEIIQFRDVVTNADGSLTLSGLLRGRRGSESFTDDHSAGDTFILLDPLTTATLQLALGEVNQTRFYRAITSGQLFEDATNITKASPGNDLKPYAPVSQVATANGNDIDFTWERRTRVGGGLKDGIGDVPINEDTEEYEVDIFDSPGGAIVRTFTGLSSPAVTYTSAQQTTDGFSPPLSQITIAVFQISAQVGRGFTKEVTLDVE